MFDLDKQESNERAKGVADGSEGAVSNGGVAQRLHSLVNGGNIFGRFFISCLILLLMVLILGLYGIIRATDSGNDDVFAFAFPLCTGLFVLHLVLWLFAAIVYADKGAFDRTVFACYAVFLSGGAWWLWCATFTVTALICGGFTGPP